MVPVDEGGCGSLMGAVFPLPRIIYAMASDGLVFRALGRVSARFQTPLLGTVLAGLFTGTHLLALHRPVDAPLLGRRPPVDFT
jgi:amino acid transporter